MANGINPYQIANINIEGDIAQRQAVQKQREGLAQTGMQKQKLGKRFEKEQEDALAQFKKKSKGGIFGVLSKLSPLIGLINPLAGSIFSGLGVAGTGIQARKAAKDLPGMEGWKSTFLSKGAKAQEDVYKGIQESAPSIFDSLLSGAISGVTAKAMGDASQTAFKGDEAIKMFGGDKTEGKFFEKLTQKLGKKTGDKAQEGFFDRMKGELKKDEMLDANWLKLLQSAPELKKGNLTDFMATLQGDSGGKKYKTLEDLEADRNRIGEEAYQEYLKEFQEGEDK